MDIITKPSLVRLSRRAGVKRMSDDCYDAIRHVMKDKLNEVVNAIVVVNSQNNKKTVMVSDVYDALHMLNHNVAHSNELNTTICKK
jgi:histone H3/H4